MFIYMYKYIYEIYIYVYIYLFIYIQHIYIDASDLFWVPALWLACALWAPILRKGQSTILIQIVIEKKVLKKYLLWSGPDSSHYTK